MVIFLPQQLVKLVFVVFELLILVFDDLLEGLRFAENLGTDNRRDHLHKIGILNVLLLGKHPKDLHQVVQFQAVDEE